MGYMQAKRSIQNDRTIQLLLSLGILVSALLSLYTTPRSTAFLAEPDQQELLLSIDVAWPGTAVLVAGLVAQHYRHPYRVRPASEEKVLAVAFSSVETAAAHRILPQLFNHQKTLSDDSEAED